MPAFKASAARPCWVLGCVLHVISLKTCTANTSIFHFPWKQQVGQPYLSQPLPQGARQTLRSRQRWSRCMPERPGRRPVSLLPLCGSRGWAVTKELTFWKGVIKRHHCSCPNVVRLDQPKDFCSLSEFIKEWTRKIGSKCWGWGNVKTGAGTSFIMSHQAFHLCASMYWID